MNILVATFRYLTLTGSETFTYTLLKHLTKLNHQITLFSPFLGGKILKETKNILKNVVVCSVDVLGLMYLEWNNFVTSTYITTYNTYNTTTTHNYTKVFKRLNLMDLDGRSLELCLPLLIIACNISEDVFENLYTVLENYIKEKKEDQFADSQDISFIDFVSQEVDKSWIFVKEVTRKFKEFLQYDEKDDWLNPKWTGQALKRLKLRKSLIEELEKNL